MRMADTTLIDRAVLRVGGAEARPFLQGLVTQDVLTLIPGSPRWSGLLTPQGKALFDFLLWADGPEDVLIDVEATAADALLRRLTLYRLRRPVTLEKAPDLAVHWCLDAASAPTDAPHDPRLATLGYRWIGPAPVTASDAAAATFRAHRLTLGVMEGQAELGSDKTLWLETNAGELNGVHYKKGCYIGQENTARMHYRNRVARRLVVLPIALSDEGRQRIAFPDLGLAIDHRRVEDMADLPLPPWQAVAVAASLLPDGQEAPSGPQI